MPREHLENGEALGRQVGPDCQGNQDLPECPALTVVQATGVNPVYRDPQAPRESRVPRVREERLVSPGLLANPDLLDLWEAPARQAHVEPTERTEPLVGLDLPDPLEVPGTLAKQVLLEKQAVMVLQDPQDWLVPREAAATPELRGHLV